MKRIKKTSALPIDNLLDAETATAAFSYPVLGVVIQDTPSSRIVDQITTETDKKYELVARMADAIVKETLKTGDCVQQDLYLKDFSPQDISAFWHFANALADVELRFRKCEVAFSSNKMTRYA